jgi:hypothetical protein
MSTPHSSCLITQEGYIAEKLILLLALTSSFNSQGNPLRIYDIWQETVNSEMLKTFAKVNIRHHTGELLV